MAKPRNSNIKLLSIVFIMIFLTACGTNQTPKTAEKPAPTPKFDKPLQDSEIPTPIKTPVPTPIEIPEPIPKKPEPNIEVGQVIGYFETTLLDKSKPRIHNIQLASQKINGHIMQPGQEFSFNEIVGKRLPEKGFKKATVLIKGERNSEEGGGICQISSTLFNAAEKSGLEIIERHSHDKDVHYLPQGRDAAIVYGVQDLKFRNTRDFPIKLSAYIKGDKMITSIVRSE